MVAPCRIIRVWYVLFQKVVGSSGLLESLTDCDGVIFLSPALTVAPAGDENGGCPPAVPPLRWMTHSAAAVVAPNRVQMQRLASLLSPTGLLPSAPPRLPTAGQLRRWSNAAVTVMPHPCQQISAAASAFQSNVSMGARPPWSPPLEPMTRPAGAVVRRSRVQLYRFALVLLPAELWPLLHRHC